MMMIMMKTVMGNSDGIMDGDSDNNIMTSPPLSPSAMVTDGAIINTTTTTTTTTTIPNKGN